MEEQIKKIIDRYEKEIHHYELEKTTLVERIKFCNIHQFHEEERIMRVKFDAMKEILMDLKELHREIKDLYNAWMS